MKRLDVLKGVFTKPAYLAVAAAASLAYYALIYFVVTHSDYGIFLVTVPVYLIYALVISGGLLLSTSIYVLNRRRKIISCGTGGGIFSVIASFVGGVATSCGCTAPILYSALYSLGFGIFQAASVVAFFSGNEVIILSAFIALNVLFIYYQAGKLGVGKRRRSRK